MIPRCTNKSVIGMFDQSIQIGTNENYTDNNLPFLWKWIHVPGFENLQSETITTFFG
jgi:hypothetical protein